MSRKKISEADERDAFARETVRATLAALDGEPIQRVIEKTARRAAPQRAPLERGALHLVRENGLLRWHIGPPPPPGPGLALALQRQAKRQGLRRAPLAAPLVLDQTLFTKIEPSKIGAWIGRADRLLSPAAWNADGRLWGLRRLLPGGKLAPFAPGELSALAGKRVLIFLLGALSSGDATITDLRAAPGGPAMLAAALTAYDCVLCFDHPTLSRSPMLDAFDLAARFAAGVPASLDLVAHGRGGLVARWFCEGFRHPAVPCRAILVGAPLAGTSLASPARVKATMDFLANTGDVLATVSSAAGGVLLGLASTLAGFFARVTGALATPLADALVALLPGLAAQAREGGNAELLALRANTGAFDFADPASPVRYFAIRSDFAPVEKGAWGILKSFVTRPGASFLDTAANFVFQNDNDLLVDTASMTDAGERDGQPLELANVVHDFGPSRTVHHCNYFAQRATVSAIRKTFGF